jgi:hypothetical protein
MRKTLTTNLHGRRLLPTKNNRSFKYGDEATIYSGKFEFVGCFGGSPGQQMFHRPKVRCGLGITTHTSGSFQSRTSKAIMKIQSDSLSLPPLSPVRLHSHPLGFSPRRAPWLFPSYHPFGRCGAMNEDYLRPFKGDSRHLRRTATALGWSLESFNGAIQPVPFLHQEPDDLFGWHKRLSVSPSTRRSQLGLDQREQAPEPSRGAI